MIGLYMRNLFSGVILDFRPSSTFDVPGGYQLIVRALKVVKLFTNVNFVLSSWCLIFRCFLIQIKLQIIRTKRILEE